MFHFFVPFVSSSARWFELTLFARSPAICGYLFLWIPQVSTECQSKREIKLTYIIVALHKFIVSLFFYLTGKLFVCDESVLNNFMFIYIVQKAADFCFKLTDRGWPFTLSHT